MAQILDPNDLKSLFGNAPSEPFSGVQKPASPPKSVPTLPKEETYQAEIKYIPENPPLATLGEKKKSSSLKETLGGLAKTIIKFGTIFVLFFALTFTIVNSSALIKKFNYFWSHSYNVKTEPSPKPIPSPNRTAPAKLIIPKINVEAPIAWNIPEKEMNDNLLKGVVHYKGTALPGENGNIFISGHSSYYAWANSAYKDIFALLDKVKVGDKVYINYQDKSYTYEIIETKVVSPKNLEVLGDLGNQKTLTLMTCVPIGTNLKRLVVVAREVSSTGPF